MARTSPRTRAVSEIILKTSKSSVPPANQFADGRLNEDAAGYVADGGENDHCSESPHRYDPVMKLKAIIHEAEEGGFWAEVPSLPGCVTQGESMEELETNLHEAIEGWLLAAEPEDGVAGHNRILEVAV